jgi:N-acetylglucosamine-6-phosphate deacetylase
VESVPPFVEGRDYVLLPNSDYEFYQAIEEAVGAIARECAEDSVVARGGSGDSFEGPFISPEDGARGAHHQSFVKPPDWELFEHWQEAAQGRIRIITWDIARMAGGGNLHSTASRFLKI